MKAAVLVAPGAGLVIEELPIPTPGAGEVLLAVSACGVCHTDLHVMKGEVAFPSPAVLGHEISGWVVAFGEGTTDTHGIRFDDTVIGAFIMPCTRCDACLRGRDDLCANF